MNNSTIKSIEGAGNMAKNDFEIEMKMYFDFINKKDDLNKDYLQIILGFLTFVGVLFAISFNDLNNINTSFHIIFLVDLLLILLTFIFYLFITLKQRNKIVNNQTKRLVLANIRYIATKESHKNDEFIKNHGKDAEGLLIQDVPILEDLKNKKSIEEIIKKYQKKYIIDYIFLIWWALLFLSVPVLFLLKILNLLK